MLKWLRAGLIILFCALFLFSAWSLFRYYKESQKQQNQFDALAQIVAQNTPTTTLPPEIPDITEEDPTEAAAPAILPEYAALVEINPDMVGWLQIEGTRINYPVMQTPDWTDYYLKRDFYGEYSDHGCLYARESCDIQMPSDNVTIYGHNMKDGSMFGDLLDYRSKSFWETHSTVYFNTLTAHHSYMIFAVFTISDGQENSFYYHLFENAQNQEEFDNYVNQCKALSLYETGITPEYGDKLITLSTCEYTRENGRLVVVAKRVN